MFGGDIIENNKFRVGQVINVKAVNNMDGGCLETAR